MISQCVKETMHEKDRVWREKTVQGIIGHLIGVSGKDVETGFI